MIFDHVGFNVRDLAASRAFYEKALQPLGIGVCEQGEGWLMLGRPNHPQLWIGTLGNRPGPIHVAFAADTREQVRAFHRAAIAAGARDNGGPGLRPQYHANYYGAFVFDPDGHNVEAVCHAPEAQAGA